MMRRVVGMILLKHCSRTGWEVKEPTDQRLNVTVPLFYTSTHLMNDHRKWKYREVYKPTIFVLCWSLSWQPAVDFTWILHSNTGYLVLRRWGYRRERWGISGKWSWTKYWYHKIGQKWPKHDGCWVSAIYIHRHGFDMIMCASLITWMLKIYCIYSAGPALRILFTSNFSLCKGSLIFWQYT